MCAKTDHSGHRERMRQKLEAGSLEDMPPHEMLEIILYYVIPRGNTNEIAHRLLNKFGSVYGVMAADIQELVEIEGVGLRCAEYLHNLPSVLGIVMRSKLEFETGKRFNLSHVRILKSYVFSLYSNVIAERAYILYLNKSFRLIKFERMSDGSFESVDLDVTGLVRRAAVHNAVNVVLTHNHPSGSAEPSLSDLNTTRAVKLALSSLGMVLLDHIIVSGDSCYSFREHGDI